MTVKKAWSWDTQAKNILLFVHNTSNLTDLPGLVRGFSLKKLG